MPVVNTQTPYGGTARNIPGLIEAEHYDLGGQGIAYFDNTTGNSGGALRTDEVDVQVTGDVTGGGHNVGWTVTGEWLEYTVEVAESGNYDFAFRVAANTAGKTMHLELDGVNITGPVNVPPSPTGGWQDYYTVVVPNIAITHLHEQHERIMRVVFDADGINFNYVSITSSNQGETDPLTQTYFQLRDVLTQDYMRPGNNGSATALITLYQLTEPTFSSCEWQFIKVPNSSYYYIVNKWTGKALQPTTVMADGSTISQVDLAGNENNDAVQWGVTSSTPDPTSYWIRNKASGLNIRPFNATDDVTGTGSVNLVQNTLVEAYSSFRWQLIVRGGVGSRIANEEDSEKAQLSEFKVYPNPASGVIHLSEHSKWVLVNLSGQHISSGEGSTIDVSEVAGGVYVIHIKGNAFQVVVY